MTHVIPVAGLPDALAATLLVALSIWVARVGRGRAANVGFALYAGATGVRRLLDYAWDVFHHTGPDGYFLLSAAAYGLAVVGLVVMAARLPEPVTARDRSLVAVAVIIGLIVAAISVAWTVRLFDAFDGWGRGFGIYSGVAASLLLGVTWAALALLALRFRTASDAAKPAYALVSVALAVNAAYRAGAVLVTSATSELFPGDFLLLFAGEFLPVVILAAVWTWNIPVSGRFRLTRWVAWLPLASALLGMSVEVLGVTYDWGMGALRLLSFALLAYAVVRHQLLGIDVKVRWGISRSTVAAAFVAVFFVASEGAQIAFGQGNEWVGLIAAGGLVFAITPLQRAAERLAQKAVPVASHAGVATAATRGADSFRRAVRLALKDRTLTHDEELDLATVAHDLGLTGPEATRIRLEVEREVRMGGAAAFST